MGFAPAQGFPSGGVDLEEVPLPTGGTLSVSGYYTNAGAAGITTMTLANTPGLIVYIERTTTQELRIKPPAGKQVSWSGNPTGHTADKYLRLLVDGDKVMAVVDANGDVRVFVEAGAIVEQA